MEKIKVADLALKDTLLRCSLYCSQRSLVVKGQEKKVQGKRLKQIILSFFTVSRVLYISGGCSAAAEDTECLSAYFHRK